LLLKKQLGKLKKFFTLESFRVIVEKRKNESIISEATIKLRVNNKPEYTVAEGDGPVNALDKALRKALHQFYPVLAEMRLADFKVRVLDEKAGTAAKVRVLIQSQDSEESWFIINSQFYSGFRYDTFVLSFLHDYPKTFQCEEFL